MAMLEERLSRAHWVSVQQGGQVGRLQSGLAEQGCSAERLLRSRPPFSSYLVLLGCTRSVSFVSVHIISSLDMADEPSEVSVGKKHQYAPPPHQARGFTSIKLQYVSVDFASSVLVSRC